jgi:hypothetical protein
MYDLYPVCERIYEKHGQSAVFDFVLNNYPEIKWQRCLPCETESPIQKNLCLVCGSLVSDN